MSKTENETRSEVDAPWTQEEVDERFPKVNAGIKPFGSRLLLQVRSPVAKTRGGIVLPEDIKDTELFLTQTAMVRELGPVAFKNRQTLEPWPEGEWVKPGIFVRIPKFNQDKWWVEFDRPGFAHKSKALFMLINDLDILGERTGNPFAIAGYIT